MELLGTALLIAPLLILTGYLWRARRKAGEPRTTVGPAIAETPEPDGEETPPAP